MISESLEQMVTNYQPTVNETPEQEVEQEVVEETVEEVETVEETQDDNFIPVTSLSVWFRNNVQNFDNIFNVNASLRGVDPNKNLIMTVKDLAEPSGEVRYPYIFREADKTPVLDLPGDEMLIFQNNTFQINYLLNDLFIKSYNLKTGMGVVFCKILPDYPNLPVPIYLEKYKKFENNKISMPDLSHSNIVEKLAEKVNMESVIIRYKQIQKYKDDIETNHDLLEFFSNRQKKIYDINHLIQIDAILISIFK